MKPSLRKIRSSTQNFIHKFIFLLLFYAILSVDRIDLETDKTVREKALKRVDYFLLLLDTL